MTLIDLVEKLLLLATAIFTFLSVYYQFPSGKKNKKHRKKSRKLVSAIMLTLAVITGLGLATSFISEKRSDFTFEYNDGEKLFLRSESTIKVVQKSGKRLSTLAVAIDGFSSKYEKDGQCNCWFIPIEPYELEQGKHSIAVGPNDRYIHKDGFKKFFKVDDILNTELNIETEISDNEKAMDLRISGKTNETVDIEMMLPNDSSLRTTTVTQGQEGEWHSFTIVVDSIELPDDAELKKMAEEGREFVIKLTDKSGNILENSYSAREFFGPFSNKTMRKDLGLQVSNNYGGLENSGISSNPPKNQTHSDQIEPTLKLEIKILSRNAVGLSCKLFDYKGPDKISYRFSKIDRKNSGLIVMKETDQTYLQDTIIEPNGHYNYFVEAMEVTSGNTIAVSDSLSYSHVIIAEEKTEKIDLAENTGERFPIILLAMLALVIAAILYVSEWKPKMLWKQLSWPPSSKDVFEFSSETVGEEQHVPIDVGPGFVSYKNKLGDILKEENITINELAEASNLPLGTIRVITHGFSLPKSNEAVKIVYGLSVLSDRKQYFVNQVFPDFHNLKG